MVSLVSVGTVMNITLSAMKIARFEIPIVANVLLFIVYRFGELILFAIIYIYLFQNQEKVIENVI